MIVIVIFGPTFGEVSKPQFAFVNCDPFRVTQIVIKALNYILGPQWDCVDDFGLPAFQRLLLNGILWALDEPVPPADPRVVVRK